jgi:hypothetical protein
MGQAVGIAFGDLARDNPLVALDDRATFLRLIRESRAPFPASYRTIKALNLGLAPIDPAQVEELEMGKNECALGGLKP